MKHQETHPSYVEGCFGCKISTINFGTVPGGQKDSRTNISIYSQREKDLHRYREKRRAGEQPDGTTKEAMDRSERKQDLWAAKEDVIRDSVDEATVASMKRSMTNEGG